VRKKTLEPPEKGPARKGLKKKPVTAKSKGEKAIAVASGEEGFGEVLAAGL